MIDNWRRLQLAREQLALSRQCLDFLEELRVEVLLILTTMRASRDDLKALASAIGKASVTGEEVDHVER